MMPNLSISQPLVRRVSRAWVHAVEVVWNPQLSNPGPEGDTVMRFMMLLPAPVQALEKCAIPSPEIVIPMRKFNADMAKAGVLLAAEGLHVTSKGSRIRVSAGKPAVTAGPST